jgi:hypothetical protein
MAREIKLREQKNSIKAQIQGNQATGQKQQKVEEPKEDDDSHEESEMLYEDKELQL